MELTDLVFLLWRKKYPLGVSPSEKVEIGNLKNTVMTRNFTQSCSTQSSSYGASAWTASWQKSMLGRAPKILINKTLLEQGGQGK